MKETAKPVRPQRDAQVSSSAETGGSFITSSNSSPAVDYSPQISALEARLNEISKKLDKEYALRAALENQVKNLEHRLNVIFDLRKF